MDWLAEAYERFLQLRVESAERESVGLQRALEGTFPMGGGVYGQGILRCEEYRLGKWKCGCGRLKTDNWQQTCCAACGLAVELDMPTDVEFRRAASTRMLPCSLVLEYRGKKRVAFMASLPMMRNGRFLVQGHELSVPLELSVDGETVRVRKPDDMLEIVVRKQLSRFAWMQRNFMRREKFQVDESHVRMTSRIYGWLDTIYRCDDSNLYSLHLTSRLAVQNVARRKPDGRPQPMNAVGTLRIGTGVELDGRLVRRKTASGGLHDGHGSDVRGEDMAAALVPFGACNAPERTAAWSANLERAVPLLDPEEPVVRTGRERELWEAAVGDIGEADFAWMGHVGSRNGTVLRRSAKDIPMPFGRNLVTALMSWRGLGHCGAVAISDAVARKGWFRSAHVHRQIAKVSEHVMGTEVCWPVNPRLDANGLMPVGSLVEKGDVLLGKIVRQKKSATSLAEISSVIYQHGSTGADYRETSVLAERSGQLAWRDVLYSDLLEPTLEAGVVREPGVSTKVAFYLYVCRNIEVGNELTDRHGNCAVVSRVVPEADMPVLPDGRSVEAIFDPIVLTERGSYGTIMEMSSAGGGRMRLRDGCTGEEFGDSVFVGSLWWAKLNQWGESHRKESEARSVGKYRDVDRQPLDGELVNWNLMSGLLSQGAAHNLLELTTTKSDDIDARNRTYASIGMGRPAPAVGLARPETARVLMKELQSLGMDVRLFRKGESSES